jgi:hypothetical protein
MTRLFLALLAATEAERQRAQALLAEHGVTAEIVDEAELKRRLEQAATPSLTPLPDELLKVRPPSPGDIFNDPDLCKVYKDFDSTDRTDRAYRRRTARKSTRRSQ